MYDCVACVSPAGEQTYELIVLDPPWENKSVKRSRRLAEESNTKTQKG